MTSSVPVRMGEKKAIRLKSRAPLFHEKLHPLPSPVLAGEVPAERRGMGASRRLEDSRHMAIFLSPSGLCRGGGRSAETWVLAA